MWILIEVNTVLPEFLGFYFGYDGCEIAATLNHYLTDGLGEAMCIEIDPNAQEV